MPSYSEDNCNKYFSGHGILFSTAVYIFDNLIKQKCNDCFYWDYLDNTVFFDSS